MNDIFTQLKHKYQYGSIVEKLIFINIFLFVITYFLGGIGSLMGTNGNIFYTWLALPSYLTEFLVKPWTIISYGFLHGDGLAINTINGFIHILFNLIFLHYIGNLFLDYFVPKKLLSFYLWGTFIGGVFFLLGYSLFPALQYHNTSLVGASSGIMAILVGLTTYIPNYELKLRFIGFVKLWKIALVFIVLDLILISDGNTGGHLAHLGGALYGFLAVFYRNNISLTNPFKNIFKKKSPLKTSYKSSKTKKGTSTPSDVQQKINLILEKISKSGYDSLNKEEKEFLFQQGKK